RSATTEPGSPTGTATGYCSRWARPCTSSRPTASSSTGSCGTVYHALWYGSDVAVKLFSKQEYSEEMINTFRQEVSLMKKLRHPSIILFMGAVASEERLCIVTEFLPRENHVDTYHLCYVGLSTLTNVRKQKRKCKRVAPEGVCFSCFKRTLASWIQDVNLTWP
uniref:Protein kinase domain-containing protein n=1 Tax=Aegilops tauschii subsp. strangulata TaxID=200361 RepID=A0A453LUA4_AEGTS